MVTEGEQRGDVAVGHEPDVAAIAPVAAVGSALVDVRLPPERDGPGPAVAPLHMEAALVDEPGHERSSLRPSAPYARLRMDAASAELHRDALVVDLHTHGTALLPRPVAAAYRAATRGSMPADVGFGELAACGVDAVVAKAVGDPVVTAFHLPTSPWRCVLDQLESLRRQAATGGAVLARDADDIVAARAAGRTAVVLGVEGADTVR